MQPIRIGCAFDAHQGAHVKAPYVSVICFYQFLFLRNLSSNNLGVDIIIKYLPNIAIGAFEFVIKKGTFAKEDKHEKYWLKLGELLLQLTTRNT